MLGQLNMFGYEPFEGRITVLLNGESVEIDSSLEKPNGFQSGLFWEALNKSKSGWYPLVSAFHKEIRRSS